MSRRRDSKPAALLFIPKKRVDYKRLMDETTSPVEVLRACLTANNITALSKLAPSLPNKKGGCLHPSSLFGAWASQIFWTGEGGKKAIPETMAGWIHRYEAIGEWIQKLRPEDFIILIDSIVYTQQARKTLDVPARDEICKRALKFSKQSGGKKKKQEDSGGMSWEECSNLLQMRLTHIRSLSNDTIQSFAQAEDPVFSSYAERYDLSKGDATKIELLLVQLILDGQAVELVDDILQVSHTKALRTRSIVQHAVKLIVQALRGQDTDSDVQASSPWLEVLQMVVANVREHGDNGGDLVNAEDVMKLLRSFCSDASMEFLPRLDVLRVLEKSFDLSIADRKLLTMYRTDALVSSAWENIEISEEDIVCEDSRLAFFSRLFATRLEQKHFLILAKLLVLWPPFGESILQDLRKNPWIRTFEESLTSQTEQSETFFDDVLTQECAVFPLDSQGCDYMFKLLCEKGQIRSAVKLVLRSPHAELFDKALSTLEALEEGVDDTELIRCVLRAQLAPSVVHMPVFSSLVSFLLNDQEAASQKSSSEGNKKDADPDLTSPEFVSRQLRDAGFEAEAGSLLLRSRSCHPLLQTFNSALLSVNR